MTTLGHHLVRGTAWSAAGKYSQYVVLLGVSSVLARLVSPEDYGLVAMALVYAGFLDVLADAGIGSAVVQHRELDDEALSSLYWTTLGGSALLAGLTVAIAPGLAFLFGDPRLTLVTRVMSANVLLLGASVVPLARMRRELAFRGLAGIELAASTISGAVAIFVALQGGGWWALAAQLAVLQLVRGALALSFGGFRPCAAFSRAALRKVAGYSMGTFGFSVVNYWSRNGDNFLVARFLGSAPLAFYSQAYRLVTLPVHLLTSVVGPVLHPVFSTFRDRPKEMADGYARTLGLIATVSFPVAGLLWALAGPIVHTLWGATWEPAIVPLQVIALTAALQPIVSTSGGVLMAAQRTGLLFRLGVINSAVMLLACAGGLPFGVTGVAAGFLFSHTLVVTPITMSIVLRLVGIGPRQFFRVLLEPALAGVTACAAAWILRQILIDIAGHIGVLLAAGLAGAPFGAWLVRRAIRQLAAATTPSGTTDGTPTEMLSHAHSSSSHR